MGIVVNTDNVYICRFKCNIRLDKGKQPKPKPGIIMTLADLTNGQEAIIIKVKGHGAFRRRILEMGFIKGKKVTVIKNAPLKDPIEYELLNYQVSLRRSEARLVEVVSVSDALQRSEERRVGKEGRSRGWRDQQE